MKDTVVWLKERLLSIYDRNPFVKLLNMEIVEVKAGEAILAMLVRPDLTNLFQLAHGGALAALADTSMGVSCASLGKRVMTLDMSINYIHGARQDDVIKAYGKVIHNGKSTLVAESEIVDSDGKLLTKARGTFFVIGRFDSDYPQD